jgi:uncharacterized protein YcaQ
MAAPSPSPAGARRGASAGRAGDLTAPEARRAALRAQGLHGRAGRPRTVTGVLARLGALQLDTISVLARSHELVCAARLGPVGRDAIEAGCWAAPGEPAHTFEYWSHAACILPVGMWPWFAFRRRHLRDNGRWHLEATDDLLRSVLERIEVDGPLTASELGGAKRGGPWWDWSPVKMAVEVLLDRGLVVCAGRRGWKRVYDLPARALPAEVLERPEPDDHACLVQLVAASGRAMGVATAGDLADYHRLRREQVLAAVGDTDLVPVTVDGWREPAWADPEALAAAGSRGRHRTTLLSPFDSLIWDRRRTQRLFGFTHRLEAYTPAPKRVHGYYAMPILAGGRLVGRVDPAREGSTLVARRLSLHTPGTPADAASALAEAAAWVGADSVAVEVSDPPGLGAEVAALLR